MNRKREASTIAHDKRKEKEGKEGKEKKKPLPTPLKSYEHSELIRSTKQSELNKRSTRYEGSEINNRGTRYERSEIYKRGTRYEPVIGRARG